MRRERVRDVRAEERYSTGSPRGQPPPPAPLRVATHGTPDDESLTHLREAVANVAARVAELSRWRVDNPETIADDGFAPRLPLVAPSAADSRLQTLIDSFELEPLDLDLLVVAAAPEFDPRFEQLYIGLQGDATRVRASVGLALALSGHSPWSGPARFRLALGAPLLRYALLDVGEHDRPFPSRPLRVPDRVIAHLLGDNAPDVMLRPLLAPLVPASQSGALDLIRAIAAGLWLCWVQERPGTSGTALAATALAELNVPGLAIDLRRLPEGQGLSDVIGVAMREAALRGAALTIGPLDVRRDASALASFDDPPCPVIMVSDAPWDPTWSSATPFVTTAGETTAASRAAVWTRALAAFDAADIGVERVAAFPLAPEQIVVAAAGAAAQAVARDRPIHPDDLEAGVRMHNAGRLERLARRVEPVATYDQLVLPSELLDELQRITHRVRADQLVRETWGVGGGGSRRRGVTCLFVGPSGVGKTLSAEVIAHELGVDLYTIDLSQIVDKYIGETEKNLERVFVEAEGVNGVLFFDEADALFGKRSAVRDAHDRYANIEVAYLLQRTEQFRGVCVMATNLGANVDKAFTRRIDVICHFPEPAEPERLRLWQLHLPATLPMDDDVDLPYLAKVLNVTGGVIRNIAIAAAFDAAAAGRAVGMEHLVRASRREARKMGRLPEPGMFGPYEPADDEIRFRHRQGGGQ